VARPVVAVTDFENLANASGRWNLGDGMADLLVTELLKTDRVIVLERKDLKNILEELALQSKDLFRKEGKAARGRLRNAQYLIQGSVTDFTESSEIGGWLATRWLRLFGRSRRARVAVVIRVSDVESGQILSSVKAEHSVSAGGLGAAAQYKDVAFGGDAFFRTPLGRATEEAIRKAVRQILRDLPVRPWEPRIADSSPGFVVINGGRNVRLKVGDEFVVREAPREITDPVSGQIIETVPGSTRGRVRVTEVRDSASSGVLLEGAADRGDYLEAVRRSRSAVAPR
jgi:curli biogenesis system outer membrane secretion channel CsgG